MCLFRELQQQKYPSHYNYSTMPIMCQGHIHLYRQTNYQGDKYALTLFLGPGAIPKPLLQLQERQVNLSQYE